MNEKRALTRYQIQQFVKVDFNREEFLPAEGLNMSAKGLLCKLPKPLSSGQKIFLMLNLGTQVQPDMVNIEGVVVWNKAEGPQWLGGIEFLDLSSEQEEKIHQFLCEIPSDKTDCPDPDET